MISILQTIIIVFIVIIVGVLILMRPYLGVIFAASSLQIIDVLPSIPIFSSIMPLLGLLTAVGYLLQQKEGNEKKRFRIGSVNILGLLFVIWIFISNPEAAWFGLDRNYILTFIQLSVLAILTANLLNSSQKQRVFFWLFSIASIASAFISIQRGFILEHDMNTPFSAGLGENANSSARYFLVGMIFLTYLRSIEKTSALRWIATAGIIITFLGIFYTSSRTGILLLIIAIGLFILLNPRKRQNPAMLFIFILATVILLALSDNVFRLVASIFPSISEGTDTMGLRYKLWAAGWRMWLDHIIQGVGIGMYRFQMSAYAIGIPPRSIGAVAHNTYIQLLSETGIVGLGIFLAMTVLTLKNLRITPKDLDIQSKSLKITWLISYLVLLMGAITMNQAGDKLLWLIMGVSVFFSGPLSMRTHNVPDAPPDRQNHLISP